jgi:haloalkane dehalogenase
MNRPFDVDPVEYPFTDRWLPYRDGHIHYVDEGKGPVVLLLHGNPTWSYLYRDVIKGLRSECRLIAPDYPGFGMSKAPTGYAFTPQEHAEAVGALARSLELTDFVLVVQDWGGPIGMSYAVHNRTKLRGVVVMNTWAWPASGLQRIFSIVMGGWPVGYLLQTRRNFFAKSMLPDGIYRRDRVTATLRRAYTDPFPTPKSRIPTWVFPRQIRKAHAWLFDIERSLPNISDVPAQILWGTHDDPGFAGKELTKWQTVFRYQETESLADASHSVPEDRPDRVVEAIRRVIVRSSRASSGDTDAG